MTELGPRTRACLAAGLVPHSILQQFQRWGSIPKDTELPNKELTREEVLEQLHAALDNEYITELRDTDLDVLQTYLRDRFKARLYVTLEGAASYLDVHCSRTPLGEFVIPWQGENIADVLTDPSTYLRLSDNTHIHFIDVRYLFFGGTRAFVVCRPES